MSEVLKNFAVPKELEQGVDDRVLAVHERYASLSYPDLLNFTQTMAENNTFDAGEDASRAIVVGHPEHSDPEAGVSVYPFAYLQTWKPSWALRVAMYHDVVNPHGVTIALPNNSGTSSFYELTLEDKLRMKYGDMTPFYERMMRTVEGFLGARAVGEVRFAGFSQGAITSLGMAALRDSDLPIHSLHAIEAPSEERSPKELKSDFTKSGGPIDQLSSIKDARLPVLSSALRVDRLMRDYARFGLDSLGEEAKVLMNAMASPKVDEILDKIVRHRPETEVVLGYIAGSKMLGEAEIAEHSNVRRLFIEEGPASHKHATGDNVIANALMMTY
jgi:hypothetical protein